jgi:hypothetical protein
MTETIKTPLERRIDTINSRYEATQEINPITKQGYKTLASKANWFYDPLQAHLKAMEKRTPSENEHKQDILKSFEDTVHYLARARMYDRDEILIYRVPQKGDIKKKAFICNNPLFYNYLILSNIPNIHDSTPKWPVNFEKICN